MVFIMKKRVMSGLVIACSVFITTGCGNAIPKMTEDQQALVVEYAAGVVLRHDANYESRLVELTMEEESLDETPSQEEQTPSEPENVDEAEMDDVPVIDNTENVEETIYTIESFLQLDSVKISYTGYEIDDSYPDESEENDLYFIMDATEGNKLLVLRFSAENLSDYDMQFDIAQSNIRFKIAVDGVEKNALTTMLLNDLAYYEGTLAPGESTELVLVCEISDEQAEGISSLALVMKSVDDTATILLN